MQLTAPAKRLTKMSVIQSKKTACMSYDAGMHVFIQFRLFPWMQASCMKNKVILFLAVSLIILLCL